MTEESLEHRRKRLRYRSWHRGTKELDLILGRFAEIYLPQFDARQLALYEAFLDANEQDIYDWIAGRAPLPAEHDHDVAALVLNFDFSEQQS